MNLRFDFGFSYWIFVWYIFYVYKLTSYNPKIALILALFENTITLFSMIYYKYKLFYIIVFCILNTLIKVLPIWYLWNTTFRWIDFYASVALFIVFLIWLSINNVGFIELEHEMHNQIKKNNPSGPATYYAEKYLNINNIFT